MSCQKNKQYFIEAKGEAHEILGVAIRSNDKD
jgi:hypothetical protein